MEQQLRSSDGKSDTGTHNRYRIEDRSYLNLIKKDIAKEAKSLGFSSGRIGKLDIIITELTSNLLKFGEHNREFLWKSVFQDGGSGIEILVLDKGPGIPNISQALRDGYSTSGTAGEGLGAIQRLSDFFDIYSQPGKGTAILVRLFSRNTSHAYKQLNIAAVSVPKPGEKFCGDGYEIKYNPENHIFEILILDGLGHGTEAFKAAQAALKVFTDVNETDPHLILRQIHQSIKNTRGAVGMALHYNFKQQILFYCGVGNISGKFVGYDGDKNLLSFNGIIGHILSPRIHDQQSSWTRGRLLILHSDGINSRWDLAKYPQIQKHDPALIAGCLYRDFNRATDDVTIIVSKYLNTNEKGTTIHH